MTSKITVRYCLLMCAFLMASQALHAGDTPADDPTQNMPPVMPLRAGMPAVDDPFAEDPFADDFDDELYDPAFSDPLQGFNRAMFIFNDKLYYYFLRPTAKGYAFILPEPPRTCLKNFFFNLSMPIRALNCLFQGKGTGLGIELWRFIINTTVGIGGLFDPAGNYLHLPRYLEDTGQTFGVYGAGPGFYLMLPFFGPSSGRDAAGKIFDIAFDPLTYVFLPGIRLIETINNTSLDPDQYDRLKAAAFDPYIAIREGYIQYREGAIAQ